MTNALNFSSSKLKAPLGLSYVFTFGKFKDYTIQHVIDEEPNYVLWCIENIEWFDVEPFIEDMAEENQEPDMSYWPSPHWSDNPTGE